MNDLTTKLNESIRFLKNKFQAEAAPEVVVTLGSGFRAFGDLQEDSPSLPLGEIPHCSAPSVAGHGGELYFSKIGQQTVAIITGRIHLYEGYPADDIVYLTRVFGLWGTKKAILTNAAGGLDAALKPGTLLALKDQINLTGQTCLSNESAELGARFVDMVGAFDLGWRRALREVHPEVGEGVYLGVVGAAYESPAETTFFAKTGANAVGMSTVHEVIAARQLGMKVLGLSFVTNLAGGLASEVNHEEVVKIGKDKAPFLCDVLRDAINLASTVQ